MIVVVLVFTNLAKAKFNPAVTVMTKGILLMYRTCTAIVMIFATLKALFCRSIHEHTLEYFYFFYPLIDLRSSPMMLSELSMSAFLIGNL